MSRDDLWSSVAHLFALLCATHFTSLSSGLSLLHRPRCAEWALPMFDESKWTIWEIFWEENWCLQGSCPSAYISLKAHWVKCSLPPESWECRHTERGPARGEEVPSDFKVCVVKVVWEISQTACNGISNIYSFTILITLLCLRVDDESTFIDFFLYAILNTNYTGIFKRTAVKPHTLSFRWAISWHLVKWQNVL